MASDIEKLTEEKINFEIKNIYKAEGEGEMDPAVGIKITPLSGDESLGLFLAEIEPNKKINAHYHSVGTEIYQIMEGSGEIHIGEILASGEVSWILSKPVVKGDCFTIESGKAHQLVNNTDHRLTILFTCPKSHLSSDRKIV
jgi:mannose-6-phosphate isomerase-like protein (cupin superfamily)